MRGKNKKFLSLLTAIALGTTMILGNGVKISAKEDLASKLKSELLKQMRESQGELSEHSKGQSEFGKDFDENGNKLDENEEIRVIVQLKDSPAIISESNGYDSNVKTKENTVKGAQQSVIKKVEAITGTKVKRSFGYLVNGFSISTTRKNVDKIKSISEVKSVTEVRRYYPTMAYADEITGATGVWNELGYKGEGMVVSIIDSGIDYRHKDLKVTNNDVKLTQSNMNTAIEQLDYGKYFTNKIPYGYNYADGNNDIIDVGAAGEHGMHVAGIVGANGSSDEVEGLMGVKGVAPEAQLLAMKVFSNNPEIKGAYDDDIIAAIEDSVKLGADVINMSLGSDAGFSDPDDPQEVAIKNATDKGVLCVISAGNAQVSTSSSSWEQPHNLFGTIDTGLIGSPSTASDALSVASMENTSAIGPALTYTTIGNATGKVQYSKVSGCKYDSLSNNHELVYCGIGSESDCTNSDGKIALIIRGDISFSEKYNNAINAGASAVIIYNHADGGNETISMAVDNVVADKPIFSVGYSDGEKLKSLITSGDSTIKFEQGGALSSENIDKGDMSQFTSWGPTSSLEFKPEITAPGGDIYSLANNNSYQSMSGTSMAAPHTSGAQALIIQGVKANGLNLSGRDLVTFAKNTAMNTSVPMTDKYGNGTIPYSPRRQGAGLLQIRNAINNKVIITNSNRQASVALKEIGNNTSFTLNLKNYGNEEITYSIPEVKVYSEVTDEVGYIHEVELEGASITFDKSSVTVPANGTATVICNLNLSSVVTAQKFVEGFVKFVGNENVPSLVMPFMGFYGDWSAEKIVDDPEYIDGSTSSITAETALIGVSGENLSYIGAVSNGQYTVFDKSKMAFSPNNDGTLDEVMPYLYMLRNSKELKIQVLDQNGDILSEIYKENNVRKNLLEEYINGTSGPKLVSEGAWDGTLYNMNTGRYENVEDGNYYIRVVNKVDLPNATPQNLDMPIMVDTVAPEIDILGVESIASDNNSVNYVLKWKSNDEASGLSDIFVVMIGDKMLVLSEDNISKDSNGNYYAIIPFALETTNDVVVATMDNAGNFGLDEEVISNVTNADVKFTNISNGMIISADMLADGKYIVNGLANDSVGVLKINGEDVEIENNRFNYPLSVAEGVNEVSLYAEDRDGNTIVRTSILVLLDTIAPALSVTPDIGTVSPYYTTTEDSINLQVSVSEINEFTGNYVGAYLGVNSEDLQPISLDENGKGSVEVNLTDGLNGISIIAADAAGNISYKDMVISKYSEDNNLSVEFYNLEAFNIISAQLTENDFYTIEGKLNNKPGVFKISGEDVTVKDDLTFEFKQKLEQGTNRINVYLEDKDGKVIVNKNYKVLYDSKAPSVSFALNIRDDNKVYTNNENFTLKGKVTDNLHGYSLYINGEAVLTLDQMFVEGEDKLQREFSKDIKLQQGVNNVLVEVVDMIGNSVTQYIPVILDKEAPVKPSINLSTTELTNKPVNVTISSNETQIDKIEYSFDGENYTEYNGQFSVGISSKVYARVTDYAGNVSEVALAEVKIDTEAPQVNITNIGEGQEFTKSVTPNVVCNDEEATITLLLNGNSYDGEEIIAEGEYILEAYATDKAGNKSLVVTRHFKIVSESGVITPPSGGDTDNPSKPGDSTKPGNTNNTGGTTNNTQGTPSKTGDSNSMTVVIVLVALMLCSGAAIVFIKKKKKVE
ncbi:S8 family serine peptidase [Clostridium paraputrificum]|uniref:S8 family serine peptidase n=1 Tax=Clostridium paraputrificum TaxID=29363 RepID=UPI003F6201A1